LELPAIKKGEANMTEISGSCSSKLQSQSMVMVQGSEDHQVGVMVMVGKHSTSDPKWDGAILTYVGTLDVTGGEGEQQGYFFNAHPNGDTSHGHFKAKVTTTDGVMAVEGDWHLLAGTGTLATLKAGGGGWFRAHMTSPATSEMRWTGKYDVG
jgi:hypothetical protein